MKNRVSLQGYGGKYTIDKNSVVRNQQCQILKPVKLKKGTCVLLYSNGVREYVSVEELVRKTFGGRDA